jgi:hypothetical protein
MYSFQMMGCIMHTVWVCRCGIISAPPVTAQYEVYASESQTVKDFATDDEGRPMFLISPGSKPTKPFRKGTRASFTVVQDFQVSSHSHCRTKIQMPTRLFLGRRCCTCARIHCYVGDVGIAALRCNCPRSCRGGDVKRVDATH